MSNRKQVLTRLFEQVSPNFDTPQKSGKAASYSFDKASIQKIKEDGITLEFLEIISKKVPVFKQLDQVVIHGRFTKVQAEQILGYRVLTQGNNLPIHYGRIDANKKRALGAMLQFVSEHKKNCPIMYEKPLYSSISFQLADANLHTIRLAYERIDTSLFYGRKEVFELSDPSGELETSYILNISISAMKQENLWPIFTNWTDLSEKQYNTLKKKAEEDQKKAEQEQLQKEQEKQKRCDDNYKKAINQLKRFQPWSGIMNNNIVLVSGLKNENNVGFVFVKLQEASKGNITMHIHTGAELINLSSISYASNQTLPPAELSKVLSANEWFLYDVGDREPQTATGQQLKAVEQQKKQQTDELELFYYSDKAVVLFGDTKPYKDALKQEPFKGVPNPRLIHPETEEKTFGWVFSNKADIIEALQEKFSITIKAKSKKVA